MGSRLKAFLRLWRRSNRLQRTACEPGSWKSSQDAQKLCCTRSFLSLTRPGINFIKFFLDLYPSSMLIQWCVGISKLTAYSTDWL